MKLKTILQKNIIFFVPYLVILAICIVILCTYSKEAIHMAINSCYSTFGDIFFKYYTYTGDFAIIAPICIGLFFISYRKGFIATAATCLAPLGTQFCKRVIWPVSPRPKVVFQEVFDLHVVEGVHLHSSHSFPSGHTTGAFAIFCCLALMAKKPVWKIVFLMLAVISGYSRMYLSQHFLIDVTVGSFIGTLTAVLCYWWISQYQKPWMDKSLRNIFSSRH